MEVAPGVLVPDGFELWPHVRPQLVRELLGLEAADHALFLGTEQAPLRLRPDHLAPLDTAMMSRLELAVIETSPSEMPPSGPAMLLNERLGRFALWGFGGATSRPEPEPVSETPELPPGRES